MFTHIMKWNANRKRRNLYREFKEEIASINRFYFLVIPIPFEIKEFKKIATYRTQQIKEEIEHYRRRGLTLTPDEIEKLALINEKEETSDDE